MLCHPGKANSSQSNSKEQKQLVSCLLSLIDGVTGTDRDQRGDSGGGGGVFIIATSSKPNNIDQAMRRPGQFLQDRGCCSFHNYGSTVLL